MNVQVQPIPKQNVLSRPGGHAECPVAAVAARQTAGDSKVKAYEMTTANASPPGCDYYPSITTQGAIASELEQQLKAELA